MAMPWAKAEASVEEGLTVPLAQRRGRLEGVIMLVISLLLSRSSSGLTRNVMYHFSESETVLRCRKGLCKGHSPECCGHAHSSANALMAALSS